MASRKPFDPFSIQAPAGDADALRGPVSVSELTRRVKRAIEDGLPGTVEVIGEISNFKRHSSGHLYFTLKDQSCELSCVMWRSAAGRMKFDPADGMEVIVVGSVEVFEKGAAVLPVEVGNHDLSSLPQEELYGGSAHTAGTASDHRYLSVKTSHPFSPALASLPLLVVWK